MKEENTSYLEKQLGASMAMEENGDCVFTFQRVKLKLQDPLEIHMMEDIDPTIKRKIEITDDEVKIIVASKDLEKFDAIRKKNEMAKWNFAYQLIQKVQHHSISRLNLFISPENIVFNRSMTPFFQYYGVKNSIPPYESDDARNLLELKAIIAAAIDGKFTFEEYIQFYETLKLSPIVKEIFAVKTIQELSSLIESQLEREEKLDKTLAHIPKKKWKIQRYILLSLSILLIPAIVYVTYFLFFLQPKHEAYVLSNQYFLESNYSKVINTLSPYKAKDMPYVVQYELAVSYIASESVALTDAQKTNVQNTITLQSDPQYFLYWIDIGRGQNQSAIDIARTLEDRDLLVYGLLAYREEVKADNKLSGEEMQQQLDKIQKELDEYQRDQEEQKRLEEEQNQQSNVEQSTSAQGAETNTQAQDADKTKEKKSDSPPPKQSEKGKKDKK